MKLKSIQILVLPDSLTSKKLKNKCTASISSEVSNLNISKLLRKNIIIE